MKKRILALAAAAIMVVSSTVMTFADTTTGLIGQYNFDGSLKNEVTGTDATVTASKVNVELTGAEEAIFANGVSSQAIYLNGFTSGYGLEFTDAVPTSNTYTLSYDVYYATYSQYSPVLFLADNWDATALWASFGNGWQADLSYAAGIWVNDVPNANPGTWMDIWQSGGTPELVDADKNWVSWTNITYVIDNGAVAVYVNGSPIELAPAADGAAKAATDSLVNVVTENSRLFLGVNAWDTPLTGAVDNLYIYDRALTADDVAELVNSRDYDAATVPEIEQPETTSNKPQVADPNNADYLMPAETTAANNNDKGISPTIIIVAAVIIVVVVVVVVVAVVASKKKTNNDDDDEE